MEIFENDILNWIANIIGIIIVFTLMLKIALLGYDPEDDDGPQMG